MKVRYRTMEPVCHLCTLCMLRHRHIHPASEWGYRVGIRKEGFISECHCSLCMCVSLCVLLCTGVGLGHRGSWRLLCITCDFVCVCVGVSEGDI